MPHAVAFSPHLDDAAFSCGGTLARLAQAGWEVTVCTVFTRSVPHPTGFALACQTDKGLGPEVDYMALRREEDRSACAALGARPLWLDWPEAPHRGYHTAAALFGAPHDTDPVPALLDLQADLLLAPQAVGGHVDHVLLARALRNETRPILWWTDFPYAARPDAARPVDLSALPEHGVHGDAPARLAACAAYSTQIGYQFGSMAGLRVALAQAGSLESFRGHALPAVLQ